MHSCLFLFAAISLLIVGLEMTSTVTQALRVDCTKFVFAPRCRGVAAKRRTSFATDGLTFDDLRRHMDDDDGGSPSATGLGDYSSSSSDLMRRSGVSQLRLRSRPNPSSTVNELRRSNIDWPINDFRSKRDISDEAFNQFFRTKKDMSDASAGREGRSQPSFLPAASAASAADAGFPHPRRTVRQTSFNRQELLDLPTEFN